MPLLPTLLALSLAAPPSPEPSGGPPTPRIRGLSAVRYSALPYWDSSNIAALLRDANGAVVPVEDAFPELIPVPDSIRVYGTRLRWQALNFTPNPNWTPPPPAWVQTDAIYSGGNRVHQNFSFGGLR